jgi:hypothetical protein
MFWVVKGKDEGGGMRDESGRGFKPQLSKLLPSFGRGFKP